MELLKDRTDIVNLVKSVAQEQGIENGEITKVLTNEKGEGFLSQIFTITVKDPTCEKKLHLLIKAALLNEEVREAVKIRKCFENEIYFYTKIYPTFKKFERSKGIIQEVEILPKCYKVFLDNHQELLCFENLVSENFELFEKKSVLDHDHVSAIFKTYGRFHGYSFALRDQNPEEYNKLTEGIQNLFEELWFDEKNGWATPMKKFYYVAAKCLVPGEDDEIITKFEKYKDEAMVTIFRKIITQLCDFSVITHGDCWSNNMMFKYAPTQNGRKISEMRLLDLQIIKMGSPVCDLSYCLYSGAHKTIFDNLNDYLKIYYDSLSSFLKQCGSDPEKLFPFEVLKEHWRRYSKFGMLMALIVTKMKLTNKDEILDVTEGFDDNFLDIMASSQFDEEGYQKRIRDLLWHMSEIDAL